MSVILLKNWALKSGGKNDVDLVYLVPRVRVVLNIPLIKLSKYLMNADHFYCSSSLEKL